MERNRVCNVSVGERTIIPVTEEMVPDLLALWETLESERIEIDIEDVVKRKFNLYYGNWGYAIKKGRLYSIKSEYSFYLCKR